MKVVDFNVPYQELQDRETRVNTTKQFKRADRIPVIPYINSRYYLGKIGIKAKDYFHDVRTHLEAQLQGQKWLFENIKGDFFDIVIAPEFLFVEEASALGARIEFSEDDIPWVAKPYVLQEEGDIEKIRKADPIEGGFRRIQLEWYREMKHLAEGYAIRFADGVQIPLADKVCLPVGGCSGISWLARDLRGSDLFALDLYDRPEWIKELFDLLVEKTITWIDHYRAITNGNVCVLNQSRKDRFFIGDDGTAIMSPQHYLELGLPPLQKLSNHLREKHNLRIVAHNCGKADHLVPLIASKLRPDEYEGFSYLTDKQLIKKHMGNKTVLLGGISPVTIHGGTPEQVELETRSAIESFQDCAGYIVMDGHNIAPGSPIENINAMHKAAIKYGQY